MAKLGKFHEKGFARWVATWDIKVVFSLAVGRFPKLEFDTMVQGMSKRVWRTPKSPRIIEIGGFRWLRGGH